MAALCYIGPVNTIRPLLHDLRSRAAARHLARMPEQRIADAHAGAVVRVRGRVQAPISALDAPLTARPCVYYCMTVAGGAVLLEERCQDFVIDDGTGHVQVLARAITVVVKMEPVVWETPVPGGGYGGRKYLMPTAEADFLRTRGVRLWLSRPVSFHEGVIAPGDEVTAVGLLRELVRTGEAGAPYREGAALRVLDTPGRGRVLLATATCR
jgi:hypothetical protein